MGGVELAGAGGPETFSGVGEGPDVEVGDLGAVGG